MSPIGNVLDRVGDLGTVWRPSKMLATAERRNRTIRFEALHQIFALTGFPVRQGSHVQMRVLVIVPRVPMSVHQSIDDPGVRFGEVFVEFVDRVVEVRKPVQESSLIAAGVNYLEKRDTVSAGTPE